MSKSAMIRARIEPEIKEEAEKVLSEVGLTPSAAIGILYRRIVEERGLPISLKIPNGETEAALEEARDPEKLHRYRSLQDLIAATDEE